MPEVQREEGASSLEQWRDQILHVTLIAAAILGAVAYVPGVFAAIGGELWLLVVVDTLAWGVIVVLAVGRRLPYRVRAAGFASVVFLIAVVLLATVGPEGGGATWLAAFPVLVAVLFGLRGSVVALGITTFAVVGLGVLIHLELVGPGRLVPAPGYALAPWAATGASVLFLSGVLSLSIAYLVRALEGSLTQSTRAREELAGINHELEAEIAERKRVQGQLLQLHKMEALATLAGGIAHDFNNLLVPILVETREVRDRMPPGSEEWESLDAVVRSAVRGRDLVRRILAFGRSTEQERRPTAVEPVIREVVGLLRSSVGSDIEVSVKLEAPDALVLGNSTDLHQVLMNLGMNGYLAMREGGGTLSFHLRRTRESGELLLSVADSGVGMSPEVRSRAFDPFFSTRAPGEGTGLGLATVHGLVTRLGGAVNLESEVGQGTVVEVRLPEHPATVTKDGEAEPRAAVAGSARRKGSPQRRILLVDDEPLVRRSVRALLLRLGYLVTEVSTAESALQRLTDSPRAYDLVLTDQAMPGMTGLELARLIRRVRSDLPIVLSSGFLDDAARARVEELGLAGVLEKPFDVETLHRRIAVALAELPPGRD